MRHLAGPERGVPSKTAPPLALQGKIEEKTPAQQRNNRSFDRPTSGGLRRFAGALANNDRHPFLHLPINHAKKGLDHGLNLFLWALLNPSAPKI